MTSSGSVRRYITVVALAALMAGFLYGFTFAIIAGAETFITKQFELSTRSLGLVVSNLNLGAAVGAMLAGPLSDRIGRRKVLLATAFLFLLSAVFTASATNVSVLVVGRAFAGLAVGATMIMPLYVAEISPAKARGLLVSFVQIGIVTGIFAAYCTGWAAEDLGPANWRWMFGAGVIPAVVFLAATMALPESPRWLMAQGSAETAHDVLAPVLGEDEARDAVRSIQETVQTESGRWWDLLAPGIRRALIVGLILAVLSVTVGINAVILYVPRILVQGAGENISAALKGAVTLGSVNFLFTFVAMVAIDRVGRKPLLVCGLIGMGLAMLVVGLRFDAAALDGSPGLLVPLLTFIAFYAVSLGPVTWVLVSEIFPTKTRGVGISMCIIVMFATDYLVTREFPSMMEELGSGAFHVFAAVCGLGCFFVLAVVPETKGKSLEQIEEMWKRR